MKRVGVPWLIGLLVAAAGVIAPIGWDWYTSRADLELQHLVTTSIVERVEGLEDLRIQYGQRPIPSVSQMDFALVNTGSRPIRKEDLVHAPTLVFGDDARVLDLKLRTVTPRNLKVSTTVDSAENAVSLSFPLLNPDDRIRFSVLFAGTPSQFSASARIVGIRSLTVADKTADAEESEDSVPWTVWLAGTFSFLCLFFLMGGFIAWGKYDAAEKLLAGGALYLPREATASELEDFIDKAYGEIRTDRDLEPVTDFLGPLPENETLSDEQFQQLQVELWTVLTETQGIKAGAAIFLILFLIGASYVIVTIL